MKRFEFSLQKVLDLREFEEKQAKNELGKAIAESDRIKTELEYVALKRVENNKACALTEDMNEMMAIERFIVRLDLRKEELLEELAKAELVIEQKRQLFAEAMKNRKVVTKLKEKKEAEYKADSLKAEESAIDDIVGAKYN
ncbi:MAG: flagellar export protein FliJ [Treponemataceae bacterium]|nr:flagellar export protein FliJ [Treponemataceae bacterium]